MYRRKKKFQNPIIDIYAKKQKSLCLISSSSQCTFFFSLVNIRFFSVIIYFVCTYFFFFAIYVIRTKRTMLAIFIRNVSNKKRDELELYRSSLRLSFDQSGFFLSFFHYLSCLNTITNIAFSLLHVNL